MTRIFELDIAGETVTLPLDILERYNVHGPRYTSYPTAPTWSDDFGPNDLRQAFEKTERLDPMPDVSLYYHIPFCEALCWYCGCNVVINKNKEVAGPYLDRLTREIDLVTSHIDPSREAVQFHFGGGTPTYLTPEQLRDVFGRTRDRVRFSADAEIGVEVDPRVTTGEHVVALAELGFNRISLGVQDFDPKVQEAVNRVQSYEQTAGIVEDARGRGFDSVNIDLMYGLPYQTHESFVNTVDRVVEISPDRIALFNYAHVPQLKHAQNAFRRMPVPEGLEKFEIFRTAVNRLTEAGYVFVGFDHFAKPDDELAIAQADRTLRRNFQGYSTKSGSDLYAAGVSSISFLGGAFAQNFRRIDDYYEAVDRGELPTMRGMWLSDDDVLRSAVIERLMCHCVLYFREIEQEFGIEFQSYFAEALDALRQPEDDGLVRVHGDRIEVRPLGRIFLRNLAMPFDAYLARQREGEKPVFSKTL
jgi:oxygen-independent coproporphyrinogen-3 oxidase